MELNRLAAERGAQLTNRLLAFSRRQTLDPKAVRINALIQDMESLMRRALGEEITMSVSCDCALWLCHVDGSQLENALLNLVVNARDAMPEGGRLTIEASNVSPDDKAHSPAGIACASESNLSGDHIRIVITDTGCGMTEDTRQRAFEPFFTTKDVGKGTGLGLSMVYGFIRQSGGQIEIDSKVGFGTSVTIFLPRTTEYEAAEKKTDNDAAMVGGYEHILVVEDDDLVRRQTVVNLRALGYRITDAHDGVEAMELLKSRERFDLLFTDVVMPRGMNGKQLAETASQLRPDMPVLFTSGYAENHIVHHGRLVPGLSLLRKPYSSSDLAKKIRSVLDRAVRA